MGLTCFVVGIEVPLLLGCFMGGSHIDQKGLMHTRMPDRNSEFHIFANLCLEMVVFEHGNHLLNTVFLGDIWNWRALCKVILMHLQSLRLLGTAFALHIVCRSCRSLGVDTINFLKEESGASLMNC